MLYNPKLCLPWQAKIAILDCKTICRTSLTCKIGPKMTNPSPPAPDHRARAAYVPPSLTVLPIGKTAGKDNSTPEETTIGATS